MSSAMSSSSSMMRILGIIGEGLGKAGKEKWFDRSKHEAWKGRKKNEIFSLG